MRKIVRRTKTPTHGRQRKKMKVNVFFKLNETGQEVSPAPSIPYPFPQTERAFFDLLFPLL